MSKFKNKLVVDVYSENEAYVRYVLRKLGYQPEDEKKTQYINGGLVTEDTGIFYPTFGRYDFNITNPDYINCGNNIELFLALASMRDDTDKYQLFVCETSSSWVNLGMWQNKGDFDFCLIDDYYMGQDKRFTSMIPPVHKASIDEIKNYLLLNPNYKPYRHWYEKISIDPGLTQMFDLANKIVKEDEYTIYANEELYNNLKKEKIATYDDRKNKKAGFFVLFNQKAVPVFCDSFTPYKMMLWKNNHPFLVVDKDGTARMLKDREYETDNGTESKD